MRSRRFPDGRGGTCQRVARGRVHEVGRRPVAHVRLLPAGQGPPDWDVGPLLLQNLVDLDAECLGGEKRQKSGGGGGGGGGGGRGGGGQGEEGRGRENTTSGCRRPLRIGPWAEGAFESLSRVFSRVYSCLQPPRQPPLEDGKGQRRLGCQARLLQEHRVRAHGHGVQEARDLLAVGKRGECARGLSGVSRRKPKSGKQKQRARRVGRPLEQLRADLGWGPLDEAVRIVAFPLHEPAVGHDPPLERESWWWRGVGEVDGGKSHEAREEKRAKKKGRGQSGGGRLKATARVTGPPFPP